MVFLFGLFLISSPSLAQGVSCDDQPTDCDDVISYGTRVDPWVIIFDYNPFGSSNYYNNPRNDNWGGGGGSSDSDAVIPTHTADQNFDCSSEGGLSNRLSNANAAFRADRVAVGIGARTFYDSFPSGAFYPYNGAHYLIYNPTSLLPLSAESEGC